MTKILLPLVWIAMASTVALAAATYESALISPPKPPREFRGAWVATVENIDWPSRRDLSTKEQKAELLAILDHAVQFKLNAIIFQVRPACDALYDSSIEPWSEYLTGTMGKPPEPFYDPLAFAVTEAHRRGLELHAWFNPYRARHEKAKSPIAANHVSKTHPQFVRRYGKYLWLDPGEKEVQDYSLSVVMDVVRRYDVDAVHFDDYFYPYASYGGRGLDGKPVEFPDEASWRKYGVNGKLSRSDWRRENVNQFVERVYRSIKAMKPRMRFGISPFGIYQPGIPSSIDPNAMNAYEELSCDSRKWLSNGWLDYLAPQLYWPIEPPKHGFRILLEWWAGQNTKGRHIWPGMNTAAATSTPWSRDEIVRQIEIARKQTGVSGHVHWNMKKLTENRALNENLSRGVYAERALIPATSWLDSVAPSKPTLQAGNAAGGGVNISWKPAGDENVWLWLLQFRHGGKWTNKILPGDKRSQNLTGDAPDAIALSALDRLGNVSSPATVALRN